MSEAKIQLRSGREIQTGVLGIGLPDEDGMIESYSGYDATLWEATSPRGPELTRAERFEVAAFAIRHWLTWAWGQRWEPKQ